MGDNDNDVAPVGVKMPKFTPDQPAIFFIMAEAQFALRGVTLDETKYYHAVSALPLDVVGRIVDLVTAPPATGKYDALKQRLTDSFAGTPNERAARILDITDLGGRRPSALKDELRNLSRGEDGDFLLRAVFLRALPDSSKSLEELAKAADEHYTTAGATQCRRK